MFWWRRQELRLCDVNTNVCDSPTKRCFPFKSSHYFFLISLFVSFFPLLISIWKTSCKALYTVNQFLQKIGRRDYNLFGAMHITLRGLRVIHVGIIYLILGKVLFQISFTNYGNILAHNTVLVTSGNSALPRLNSSRKSSYIPPPNPVTNDGKSHGPIPLSFGRKWNNVTTPVTTCKLAVQNVSFNAYSYRTGSGHCIRDISRIW